MYCFSEKCGPSGATVVGTPDSKALPGVAFPTGPPEEGYVDVSRNPLQDQLSTINLIAARAKADEGGRGSLSRGA